MYPSSNIKRPQSQGWGFFVFQGMIIHTKTRKDRQAEYAEFLRSDFWWNLRREAIDIANRRCSRCPSTRFLQAHHTLYRPDWYQTQLEDLIVLCEPCHRKEHGIKKPSKNAKISPEEQRSRMLRNRATHIRKQKRRVLRQRNQWSF